MEEEFISNGVINREKFLEIKEYLHNTRLDNPHKSLEGSKDFAFARASSEKLMPSSEIENIYHQINYYRGLTWIQQRCIIDSLSRVKEDGDMSFFNTINEPRIYCTFHMASYRMPIFKILEKGIDLAFVLASKTLEQQHESFTLAHEEMKKKLGLQNTLSFIDAESPSGVIQMVRALKEGKSLLFYIDGNTGVGGTKRNDDKMIHINFLGAKMLARKGIAYIASKCKVPIITTICQYISDEDMKITYYPPINMNSTDINESSGKVTQSIYDNFSTILKKYPSQWEGWIFLPRFLDTQDFVQKDKDSQIVIKKDKRYAFNKNRFYRFNYIDTLYLLDKETFQTYPSTPDLLNILDANDELTYEKNILPQDVFKFLVNNEILIPS
ncbi:MAG: hypothetical protein E6772_07290 [Dysgonomonas sp.]|nr:hypothetical protein [Dysgonomonas sp.]